MTLLTKSLGKKIKGKPKKKPVVKSILIRCVPCGQNFTALRKDNKGEFVEQQICQHTILVKVLLK